MFKSYKCNCILASMNPGLRRKDTCIMSHKWEFKRLKHFKISRKSKYLDNEYSILDKLMLRSLRMSDSLSLWRCIVKTLHLSVQMIDLEFAYIGPAAFDVGCLVANYIFSYYQHMSTEYQHDKHRKFAYSIIDICKQTGMYISIYLCISLFVLSL